MAEFPENQDLEQDELSTVFSDPLQHRNITVKPKKLFPKILAGVLCLAVLIASTVAIVKLIPKKEEEEVAPSYETISVKSLDTDSISSVAVVNSNGNTELYSETVTKDEAEDVDWFVKDIDSSLTVSMNIENTVSAVAKITAMREITAKNAEECGFNSPVISAVVTPKEGEVYTVLIGDKSPDNSGYYLKLSENDSIYLVSSEIYDTLQFNVLDFATTESISGFDSGDSAISDYYENSTISKFDKLVIKDKDKAKPLEIVSNPNTATSEYYAYMITSPEDKLFQTSRFDDLSAAYTSGITTSGAYSYDVSPASLKKTGLDNPDIQTTMYLGDKSLTYKFALQEDGYYAVISDNSKLIQKVSASVLTGIVDLEYEDYYATALFVVNISDISNFSIKTAEKNFSFDITKNEVDETDAEKLYTITSNSVNISVSNFQNFYYECVSLKTKDFITDNVTSSPEITITITLHNGSKVLVEFTKVNTTRYQCTVDGINMGRVTSTSLNKVLKDAEKAANNETVTSSW